MCFFFFKQKTAYEMRISDWSSDVCSSDLEPAVGCAGEARTAAGVGRRQFRLPPEPPGDRGQGGTFLSRGGDAVAGRSRCRRRVRYRQRRIRRLDRRRPGRAGTPPERKSVVEGKSVSVRVDPGGRRNHKKKTEEKRKKRK